MLKRRRLLSTDLLLATLAAPAGARAQDASAGWAWQPVLPERQRG